MGQFLKHLAGETGNVSLLRQHHDGLHDGQDWDEQGSMAGLATSYHCPVEQRRHPDNNTHNIHKYLAIVLSLVSQPDKLDQILEYKFGFEIGSFNWRDLGCCVRLVWNL